MAPLIAARKGWHSYELRVGRSFLWVGHRDDVPRLRVFRMSRKDLCVQLGEGTE